MMWLRFLTLVFVGFVLTPSARSAPERPLKLSVRREWEGARTSAPVSLRAFIKWDNPGLLEGHLQVQAFVDETRISRWTGIETALSGSEQVLWFMSPRPILLDKTERYVLEAQFLSAKHSFETEQLDVEVRERGRRVMVIAILGEHGATAFSGLGAEGNPTAFEQPLLLQQNLLVEEGPDLHVHLSRVTPADMPADALRLLGLDALLVSHEMLNQFRSVQLDALRVWVLAGGSVALIQTGPLRSEAQEFVRSLSQNEWPSSARQTRGLPDGVVVHSAGFGQLIVATQALAGDSAEWARVARLMIRMQPGKARSLEVSNTLRLRSPEGTNSSNQWPSVIQPLEPRPRVSIDDLTNQLMPQSIHGMPFGLAASVLACCLFCIAPGDYLLLGLLKRRKWTWVLFPLVAFGFTGWMAHLAAEHNGRNDSRTWISLLDMTTENEVVRTSRLEMTYGASGRTVAHPVQDQWWTDMRQEDLVQEVPPDNASYGFSGVGFPGTTPSSSRVPSPELGERLSYFGSVPGNYVVEEPVRQWAPRLQRITTLGADPELANHPLPQVDWNSLTAGGFSSIAPAIGPAITKVWPQAIWKIQGASFNTPWQSERPLDTSDFRTQNVLQIVSGVTGKPTGGTSGVFSLLTEISPTAAPDCEDLIIADRTTAVIVNEVEPGRYIVLRVLLPLDLASGVKSAKP